MRSVTLGRTGLNISELGFGGAPVGNLYAHLEEETARSVLDAAWDGGIRYFDTAPHYGLGLSERRLGAALQARPRDQFVISTKVGRLLVPNPQPTGSDLASGGFDVEDTLTRRFDFSRDGVLRSLEASLARLGLNEIDVVYVHDPENHMEQALGEAIPALIELRDQGVIGAVGVGMNFVEPLRRVVAQTEIDVVLVAGRWTLIDRSAGPLLAECLERGVAVIAAGVFNSGLLAQPAPSADALFDYRPVTPEVLAVARSCARVCEDYGATLPTVALRFALRHPAVCSVLAGIRTLDDCVEDISAFSVELDERLWSELPAPIR